MKYSTPFYTAWATQQEHRWQDWQRAQEQKRCSPLSSIVLHVYQDQRGNHWGDLTLYRTEREVNVHLHNAHQCMHARRLFHAMCRRHPDAYAAWLETNAVNGLRASEFLALSSKPQAPANGEENCAYGAKTIDTAVM